MSYPPAALGRFTWRKHHGPETTGTITWDGKGKAIGRKQPTLGLVHDHDLFISTAVVLWQGPRDKFWPSDSSGGLVIPTDFNRSCWGCSSIPHISGAWGGCRALVFTSCLSFLHRKYPETTPRRFSGGQWSQGWTKLLAGC